MKSVLPALSFLLILASCSTAYKSGQTPDDVYFSPQHPQDEYVRVENKQDKYQYNGQDDDDRYLRMKVRNRQMWSDLDYYYNDPLAYRYYGTISPSYYYSNPWNYYNSWNYYYNPYASKIIVVNPKNPVYNRPRMTNLNVYYDVQNNNNYDGPANNGKTRVFGTYSSEGNSSSPRRSNAGENLRNIFNNNNSSSGSSSSNNTPARTTTPSTSTNTSSSSSSSSSGSGSTNAPVRKF